MGKYEAHFRAKMTNFFSFFAFALLKFLPTVAERKECADFTVAECAPGEVIRVEFDNITESTGAGVLYKTCEDSCIGQDGSGDKTGVECLSWEVQCTERCKDQQSSEWVPPADICNDLVEEDCEFLGKMVKTLENIRSDEECKPEVSILAPLYGSKYFVYKKLSHECNLYDSSGRNCKSMTGTRDHLVEDCFNV